MEQESHESLINCAWHRLNSLEGIAHIKLLELLRPFDGAFRDTYESGLIAPLLRAEAFVNTDVRCAALHFKRVLNDLRSVWLLLRIGYTSQAASIAASLFENALGTICLTISPANVEKYLASETGELPWSPMAMAKMVVEYQETADYENQWRALYAHYVWLCQIKHPTLPSVIHDISGSSVQDGYVVMAIPNISPEDMPLKAQIAILSLHRTQASIDALVAAFGFKGSYPDTYQFADRFSRAKEAAWSAFEPYLKEKNPISIHHTWFVKKFQRIK